MQKTDGNGCDNHSFLNKADAVVFDMDGVLFDTERLALLSWMETAEEFGIQGAESVVYGCIGRNQHDSEELWNREIHSEHTYEECHEVCSKHFNERIERDGIPVKRGVRELLQDLKEQGYRIALASSTRRQRVIEQLEMTGIRDCFEVVVGGDMVVHSKPDPEIYLIACRELNVEPAKAIAIEDSPNGIRSAHDAGMQVIMVPDLIASTQEIRKLLTAECENLLDVRDYIRTMDGRLFPITRVPLAKMCNTRDLGGMPGADGRRIKYNRLIRSGAPFDGTAEDLRYLQQEKQVRVLVDFRTGTEKMQKPEPVLEGQTYVEIPVLEEKTLGITREGHDSGQKEHVVESVLKTMSAGDIKPEEYMQRMYSNLIGQESSRKGYRRFFELLLQGTEGAVLWHCTAGKDRAGTATMLLLAALGVGRDQILADYMKVNEFAKEEIEVLTEMMCAGIQKGSAEDTARRRTIRFLFTVDRSYGETVFAEMERIGGSVEGYLKQEMGLDDDKLKKLRDMYLE